MHINIYKHNPTVAQILLDKAWRLCYTVETIPLCSHCTRPYFPNPNENKQGRVQETTAGEERTKRLKPNYNFRLYRDLQENETG